MDELELIASPLSTEFELEGHFLRVEISGLVRNEWILEVVDEENTSTLWDDPFESDHAALAEFHRFISEHGAADILNADDST